MVELGAMGPHTMSGALELLHKDLQTEVNQWLAKNRPTWQMYLSFFHHRSVRSQYIWTSILLTLITTVSLCLAAALSDNTDGYENIWLFVEAVLIVTCLIFNIYVTIVTSQQEKTEFARLLKLALAKLSLCMKYNTWNRTHFPQHDSPMSPCVSLQWTLRDDYVYNIPVPLLVKGDIILIRPGHRAPALCKLIQDDPSSGEESEFVLDDGDTFTPTEAPPDKIFTTPQGRQPMKTQKFVVMDTPYVKCLRRILADQCKRPFSTLDHEKHILTVWTERRIIPVIMVIMFIVNIVRYNYVQHSVGHWAEMLIELQFQAVVPLLSLVIPIMWLFMNSYGQARVFSAFETAKGSKPLGDDSFDTDSSISANEARVNLQWGHIGDLFQSVLFGQSEHVTRKINLAHILGSVTTLCCVDKKGILSYPNPTPEKVFFLRRGDKDLVTKETHDGDKDKSKYKESGSQHVEVLDITSNPKSSCGLHFDDPQWKRFHSSLKPLGLTILANTCNPDTAPWYTQFADHVTCEALENEETVAVVNRRCMCALSKEIGFSEKALDIFKLEKTYGLYRQVSAEATTKERLQRAKSFIQHKIPMPNMMSVVVREKMSGACQLLSQGTADILLGSCSDYWDGEDVTPLSQAARKKILDFYHRTSIGSFCTSFSYRPVRQTALASDKDIYIELPDDSRFHHMIDTSSLNSIHDCEVVSDSRYVTDGSRSFSADSLLDPSSLRTADDTISVFQSQCNQIFIGMVTMQYQARPDFIQLIDKLEGACIRFVHFSQENEVRSRVFAEKMGLEAGWNCHISLRSENQYLSATSANNSVPGTSQADLSLKLSRYTSQQSTDKGDKPLLLWKSNDKCTDSLQQRSISAPSIVNLGSSHVKFETNVKTAIVSPRSVKKDLFLVYKGVTSYDDQVPLCGTGGEGQEEEVVINIEEGQQLGEEEEEEEHIWDSDEGLSRQGSSFITDNTEDSLALDNRAKLPRGIENIRPHLQSIDNVPLLVNLFTDCTTETTQEMISIMQEHGEIVVCVGSAVNIQNVPLFLQADCSFALEPYCPQLCLQQPSPQPNWDHDIPTPLQLASSLIGVTCPILISKDENISLIHLIAEARSHLMAMRNCFHLMLCCSLSVSVCQVLACLLFLPPILSPAHIIWLVFVIIPLLGLTMMGNPVDPRVMSLATRKNLNHITGDMIVRFTLYFVIRFLPPVLMALFCYSLTLHSFCLTYTHLDNSTSCALYNFKSSYVDGLTWYSKFSGGIILAQNIFTFLLVLYFVVISISFVHWTDHQASWRQFPTTNRLCLTIIPLILSCQVAFFVCDTYIRNSFVDKILSMADVDIKVWILGLTFPLFMFVVNELVKHREIKLAVRYQKRARLDFGTKLGMNSPF